MKGSIDCENFLDALIQITVIMSGLPTLLPTHYYPYVTLSMFTMPALGRCHLLQPVPSVAR